MKGIKKSISSFSRTVFTAIFAAFAVAGIVSAATTISTDVTTAGNVYASSTVQATGAITGYGALNITGVSTLTGLGLFNGGASSTLFSSYGPAYFGATATSSFATNGALTLVNALTYGGVTLSNAVTGTGNMVLSASPTFTGTPLLSGFISTASSTVVGNFTSSGLLSATGAGTSTLNGIQGTYLNLTGANTATSTASHGFNLTGGCFAVSGTCISGGGASLSAANTWTALQNFSAAASSTLFSSYGPAYFGATATSSFATNGALTLVNALTYGGVTLSNAVTGTGNMVLSASPTLTGTAVLAGANFSGIASTTQLKVGNDQISTVSGMIFGSCTLVSVNVTATSSAYTTCTGATGVTSSYSVFLQVNNVMPSGLIVDAASSTATTGTLELRIFNADATNTPSTLTTGTPTINFWAVR